LGIYWFTFPISWVLDLIWYNLKDFNNCKADKYSIPFSDNEDTLIAKEVRFVFLTINFKPLSVILWLPKAKKFKLFNDLKLLKQESSIFNPSSSLFRFVKYKILLNIVFECLILISLILRIKVVNCVKLERDRKEYWCSNLAIRSEKYSNFVKYVNPLIVSFDIDRHVIESWLR